MATASNFRIRNGLTVGTIDVINSSGVWIGPQTNIKGPQGPTGTQGATGTTSAVAGPQGATGPQGSGGGTVTQVNALGVNTAAFSTTGEIRATAGVQAFYSDKRLKENIKPIDKPLERLQNLSGVYFEVSELGKSLGYTDENRQIGVIAQRVKESLPQAVKIAPFDADIYGESISGENYLTVQYEKIVPLLIESLKEQKKQIDYLKSKI
jgi:hypothetical protein